MFRWVVVILILLFVYHVREVFPPFVVGGIIAYLLFPLVERVSRLNQHWMFKWMSPGWAIGLIYLLTAATIGVIVYKFGPTLGEQISGLIEQRHELATNLVRSTSDSFNLALDVQQTSQQVLAGIEGAVGKPEEIVHFGGMLSHGLLSLLVCIVSSIYFIVDSQRVGRFFLRFVPSEKKTTMVNMIGQMNMMLSKYVVGQLILIALMSAVAWTFLTCIFHLKYALLIAILSGCFEIIPVLGPFIAISIAVIVGVSQQGMSCAVGIIACYMIARWLEDYLVVPAIIGHAVELHPLAVIFAVLVGETMAGALGMLIAIPVAASVKVIIDTFYPPEEHEVHPKPKPNVLAGVWNAMFNPPPPGKADPHAGNKPTTAAAKPQSPSTGTTASASSSSSTHSTSTTTSPVPAPKPAASQEEASKTKELPAPQNGEHLPLASKESDPAAIVVSTESVEHKIIE